MKKCLIYSLLIYIILYISLNKIKPKILYENGHLKSWFYFINKINNGIDNYDELICIPTITLVIVLFSFLIGAKLEKKN